MKKLLVLVVLILVGASSWAQNIMGTGQWLHDLWISAQKADNQTATMTDSGLALEYQGYVVGAGQVMDDAHWVDLSNTTWGQWSEIVGKYLDAHPEQWNYPAQVLVYFALSKAWPGKVKPLSK